MNSAVVVRNDAESFQDLGGSSQSRFAYVTLSSPPPPTALLLGLHSPIAGTPQSYCWDARTRSRCCSWSRRRRCLAALYRSSSRCRASCSALTSVSSPLPGTGHAAFEGLGSPGQLCSLSAPGSLRLLSCPPEASILPSGAGATAGRGVHTPSWAITACVSCGPGILFNSCWGIDFPGDLQRSLE